MDLNEFLELESRKSRFRYKITTKGRIMVL